MVPVTLCVQQRSSTATPGALISMLFFGVFTLQILEGFYVHFNEFGFNVLSPVSIELASKKLCYSIITLLVCCILVLCTLASNFSYLETVQRHQEICYYVCHYVCQFFHSHFTLSGLPFVMSVCTHMSLSCRCMQYSMHVCQF